MKTIEEKIKAYDEALEKAVKMHRNYKGRVRAVDVVIEEVFPEILENEDEESKKWILEYLYDGLRKSDEQFKGQFKAAILWLENQGEQKPAEWHREDEQNLNACLGYIQDEFLRRWLTDIIHVKYDKSVDKVEPKFKVGDWVVYNRNDHSREILQIYDIRDNRYYFNDNIHFSWSIKECDEKSHLWTIQDAKDGDALVFKNNIAGIIICKSPTNYDTESYCRLVYDSFVSKEESGWDSTLLVPATKEQRDLLFQKMKEAGYEWDAEHKQLRKIENEIEIPFGAKDSELQEATYYIPKGFHAKIEGNNIIIKRGEQKPTWSKEDDKILKSIIINIENLQFSEDMQEKYRHIPNANKSYYQIKIDWLKSLKERMKKE